MSKANKVFAAISNRSWIADISDERAQGNSIIVTLKEGWFFNADPSCGTRGFDSVRETAMGTSRNSVNNPSIVKKVKVSKVPKASKIAEAPTVSEEPVETKPAKVLSMTKDAIRKREQRALAKADAKRRP